MRRKKEGETCIYCMQEELVILVVGDEINGGLKSQEEIMVCFLCGMN
jgi:hypothetical protein